jgi:hypothetical protein
MTHIELAFFLLAIALPVIGGGIVLFLFMKVKPPPGS